MPRCSPADRSSTHAVHVHVPVSTGSVNTAAKQLLSDTTVSGRRVVEPIVTNVRAATAAAAASPGSAAMLGCDRLPSAGDRVDSGAKRTAETLEQMRASVAQGLSAASAVAQVTFQDPIESLYFDFFRSNENCLI